ncbi:MAG: threonine synthase [Actinomycetales bacterium]|nr:threonine synthase [Actinomycetales bacterium]
MSRHVTVGVHQWHGVIEEYRDRLPVSDSTPVITLREGGTPLVAAGHLSELTGCEVHLKVEGQNPTGSFKDRGMTLAISKAAEEGAQAVICASTGNTSASAAAYAVKAGMLCAVLVPQGKIALGKLAQALVHGARLLQVDGNFDDCLTLARKLSESYPVSLVNSVNPARIEGQKTAAFEIVDFLGDAPDIHCLPVGNAGNITAYWRGFTEYAADGVSSKRPREWGFQAAGAAPIVNGAPVTHPSTIATAIRIGNPASWDQALAARDESGGRIDAVTDRAILAAYRLLAAKEGVFVEPASAASVAGLLQVHAEGGLDPGQRIVCTVTGHGLKDPDWAIAGAPKPVSVPVDAHLAAVELGLA